MPKIVGEVQYTHELAVYHKLFGERKVRLCVEDAELFLDIINIAQWPRTAIVNVSRLNVPNPPEGKK
jgi:hypothetical protein